MMASTSRGESFVFLLTLLVTYVSTSSIAFHNTEYLNMTGLTYERQGPSSVIKTWIPVYIVSNNYNNHENCSEEEYFENNTCHQCLTNSDQCEFEYQCCFDEFLECAPARGEPGTKGCFCKDGLEWEELSQKCLKPSNSNNAQFIMAAQIALGASLVVAVSALTALTCKMCSSRRELEEMRRRDSGTSSLNSIQRFVISRLRDRPPRYDDVPDKPPSYVELPPTTPLPPPPTATPILSTELRQLPPNPPEYSTIISDEPSTSNDNHYSLITSIHEDGSLSGYSTGSVIPLESIETSGSLSRNTTGSIRSSSTISDNSVGSLIPSNPIVDAPDYVEIIVPNAVIFTTQISTNNCVENGIDNPAFVDECHM